MLDFIKVKWLNENYSNGYSLYRISQNSDTMLLNYSTTSFSNGDSFFIKDIDALAGLFYKYYLIGKGGLVCQPEE